MMDLPRLSIPSQGLPMQQPFDGRQQPIFSPALPSTLQQSFHPPPFHLAPPPLQTPMQPFFPPRTPYLHHHHHHHHKGHSSIAHFPPFPGPPPAVPITPLGQTFSIAGPPPPFGQPAFVPRTGRRAPSISIGGPPKAPLGGPGRKHSPLPPAPPAAPTPKGKKVAVHLPVETIPATEDAPAHRPPWARTPMPTTTRDEPVVLFPEPTTADAYPPDSWRHHIPDTVDVFLPGKVAWDEMKQRVIEEKLEKLGVERGDGGGGLGTSVVSLHAPHARAASISSPADPSLLYFKLNKLQQSQNASAATSLTGSPHQTFDLAPSPGAPRLQQRHGHSLSFAPPPPPSYFNPTAAFNPFGPSAVLGSDSIELDAEHPVSPPPIDVIHAPQGRVPMSMLSLAPPPSVSRGSSRPDFVRGFGLDIPEEEEPPEDRPLPDTADIVVQPTSLHNDEDSCEREPTESDIDGMTAVAPSTSHHSRQVSRLSHTLSLHSVGGIHDLVLPEQADMVVPIRSPVGNPTIDDLDKEAVGEWTGSEDVRLDSDDEESIGEWSNPSDEERARQERMRHRLLRPRNQEIETPRRLPNFPVPPPNVFGLRVRREYDLVSNPSEDGMHAEQRAAFLGLDPVDFTLGPSSTSTPGRRPLPPLPHSRDPSAHLAPHSRSGSDAEQRCIPSALNPHAKPFEFGTKRESCSRESFDGAPPPPPPAPAFGHARLPSFGKPLNAAAQEFKPTGFTFRPPPGVPQLAFPVSPASRPLPTPPVRPSPARAQQGREKRQRRGSRTTSSDGDDDSGKENMASFRFPAMDETPHSIRHTAPSSPRKPRPQDLHASGGPLQPLTFSGFPTDSMRLIGEPEGLRFDEGDLPDNDAEEATSDEEPLLAAIALTKPKRAPIPLDFKNPPSTNTVPAGVFKALVGDEKTRRTVRSRLGSREILEHTHRPSLDDFAVPAISMSVANRSRSRLVTDPGLKPEMVDSPDVFTPSIKRRSSLPAMHSAHNSSLSNVSIPAVNLIKRLEAQALEDKIEALLDDRFQMIRSEIINSRGTSTASISPATEDAIAEVVALFRTQLQESAARGLDDSQMDARGELDLELIRDVIQRGHSENLLLLQTELREALSRVDQTQTASLPANEMEQIGHRNLQVILNTLGQLSNKIDTRPFAEHHEKRALIEDILAAFDPHFNSLRPEAIDYEELTARLSRAVKPEIEQLIDLTADKRETAGLIMESLIPLLPSPPSLDSNMVVEQITSEVRRVIAPIDAHEIKEQVADLVVERLDARLANRDKAFNVDSVSNKVAEGVLGGLQSIKDVAPTLETLTASHSSILAKNDDLAAKHVDVVSLLSGLSSQMEDLQRTVEAARATSESAMASSEVNEAMLATLHLLQATVEGVAHGQNSILAQKQDLVGLQDTLHQALNDRMSVLPESLTTALTVLQNAHAEFAVSREAAKCDAEEIRKLRMANNDFQVQLVKARGGHGQIRVEKETLGERLRDVESDRDSLRARVDTLQAAMSTHASEASAMEHRNTELEDALAQSLARLKTSDVVAQSNQERIAELERANRDAAGEQQVLKDQLGELQIQVKMAERERELTEQSLVLLRQERESLIAQQSHWDDLRRVTEHIDTLARLRSQADEDELKELRRARDQHRQLESDYSALQKRVRDQELRTGNSERAASAAKQNLIQAQQRASEWERRAREYESDLEMTRIRLDEVEQTQVQLDADYSLAKLQLEEKEAEDRLVKDREHKLRDQVAGLEAKLGRLEAELSKAKVQALPTVTNLPSYGKSMSSKNNNSSNNTSPPRPDSRASTVFGGSTADRSRTPVGRLNGSTPVARSDTPPQSSVWDSMHAPKKQQQQRYSNLAGSATTASSYVRRAAPTPSYRPPLVSSTLRTLPVASPTPSTVSLTPTMDEDGWWS